MKRLYKRKEPPGAVLEDHSVVQEALVPSMTVFKRAKQNIGTRCHNYRGEKVYLGVRVRMPVRDLLKNIRGSRGADDLNKGSKKGSGDMKRARPRSRTKATRGEHPVKSLEELATILEVLEDDLRTSCASHSPSQNVPSPDFSAFREPSPTDVIHGDEYDQTTPSPEYYTEFSPSTPEYDVAWSRPDCMFFSLQPSCVGDMQIHSDREQDWFKTKRNLDLNSSAFFWTQLQQEEGWLRAASDAELLTTDEQGRTLLHRVVCVGKRAQAYAIAKRMAVINSLDLKDSSGMTALLYAANHNQHLIVADLIQLGANINQRNNLGKSCLHLSAENGYIRVLEVLKQQMMNGLYIDVEATDNSGMTVLQCASVALKTSMSEVDSRTSLSHNRLHTLRLEHMMETLKCLLQMDSFVHTAAGSSLTGDRQYAAQSWLNSQLVCPAGLYLYGNRQ